MSLLTSLQRKERKRKKRLVKDKHKPKPIKCAETDNATDGAGRKGEDYVTQEKSAKNQRGTPRSHDSQATKAQDLPESWPTSKKDQRVLKLFKKSLPNKRVSSDNH